ncbi:MAG: IS3 family transposase [bacterium]
MKLYPFIEAEKAEQRNVNLACAALEVSRTAFYDWAQHVPSNHERTDAELLAKIQAVHTRSRKTYGAPRVHKALTEQGERHGKKRVARLMRTNGICGRAPRRFKRTTIPGPEMAAAIDLIKRSFAAGTIEINRAWCGDITYVRTWEGWLYVATVIDIASRRVVGWAMADHMRTELVADAMGMALEHRRPDAGLIFHSDRGCQYTSDDFGGLLDEHGIRQSLSRPGQCWDNAVAESFFATLKLELIYQHAWPTRAAARRAIFEFIEGFYNQQRLHSSIGYQSPARYEAVAAAEPANAA